MLVHLDRHFYFYPILITYLIPFSMVKQSIKEHCIGKSEFKDSAYSLADLLVK
jgi:hypothetical protein